MKHILIYEGFKNISQKGRDLFDLEFKMILHNRTVIKGPIYNEDEVKTLLSDKIQYSLVDSCYYGHQGSYTLDSGEIKRAECAEKNLREYLGGKLDDLECEIIYYRPMYIESSLNYIKVLAPGANWGSGNELKLMKPGNAWNRYTDDWYEWRDNEVIPAIKEFVKNYEVSHVLPHGPNILRTPLRSDSDNSFTPIGEFDFKNYYY
jgi:hypothetical protein